MKTKIKKHEKSTKKVDKEIIKKKIKVAVVKISAVKTPKPAPVSVNVIPTASDDEKELAQLQYLFQEMTRRNLQDIGTLGRVIEILKRKIQSR